MDRLKAMQTFVQIADQGSLTRAARALGSSLPAVVRALAALETHLGVRLFHRTTRRISLTEEGRSYLHSAREVLAAADAADRALTLDAAEPAGHLTVTAPVLFGHMYVAPAIVRFLQRHTRMRCSVLLHDRPVNLLEEGVDVGIRISALEDSSLVAQQLGSIRRVVVASPAWLRAHGRPAPSARAGARQLRLRAAEHLRAMDVPGERPAAARWRSRATSSSTTSPRRSRPAPPAWASACSCPTRCCPWWPQGRLEILLEDFEAPPRPVSVIYPHARLLPARTRAFIDWMKAEFSGLAL